MARRKSDGCARSLTVGAFAAIEIVAMSIIRNCLPVSIAAVVMVVAVLVLTSLTLLREHKDAAAAKLRG
jgi:hypothetical protein